MVCHRDIAWPEAGLSSGTDRVVLQGIDPSEIIDAIAHAPTNHLSHRGPHAETHRPLAEQTSGRCQQLPLRSNEPKEQQ